MRGARAPTRPRVSGSGVPAIALVLACLTSVIGAEYPPLLVPASHSSVPEIGEVVGPLVQDEDPGLGRQALALPSNDVRMNPEGAGARMTMELFEAGIESLLGDAYGHGKWRPLTFATFLTEGWDEAWGAAPAGGDGLTPRHGWLGADAGLFYRLWHTTFTYAHHLDTPYHGDQYTGSYNIFLPFSRRFELRLDVPFVVSNGTTNPRQGYTSQFGDLLIVPRFMLSETKTTSQLVALDIRTPTGTTLTGNGLMALTPRYEFWSNPVGPWVIRGLAGIGVPLNRPSEVSQIAFVVGIPSNRTSVPTQTTFHGDFAVGRYFTRNKGLFGDLVLYAVASWRIPLEGDRSNTFVSVGPGTRFEIAEKTFLLGFFEVPLTAPRVVDYLMQFSIMRVF